MTVHFIKCFCYVDSTHIHSTAKRNIMINSTSHRENGLRTTTVFLEPKLVVAGQTWHLSTQSRNGERTGRRLLWSTTLFVKITDPTIWQPGFNLPRHTWSLMNRFRTGQGPCRADLHKWGLAKSPSCVCDQRQTMNHIVNTCPLTKFEEWLNLLHKADDNAVIWLESS